MELSFKLKLVDLNPQLCEEFKIAFANYPEVEIINSRFETVEWDCIVSAANSFGLMDGGIDGAITAYFGKQMMDRVQQHIIKEYAGEQPIGTSFIVEGTDPNIYAKKKFVAHTPTMRIPMDVSHTDNVYRAMKAMLLAVNKHNEDIKNINIGPYETKLIQDLKGIHVVACCGLGTLAGRVPYKQAALQMAKAYRHVTNPPTEITWDYAVNRNLDIIQWKRG